MHRRPALGVNTGLARHASLLFLRHSYRAFLLGGGRFCKDAPGKIGCQVAKCGWAGMPSACRAVQKVYCRPTTGPSRGKSAQSRKKPLCPYSTMVGGNRKEECMMQHDEIVSEVRQVAEDVRGEYDPDYSLESLGMSEPKTAAPWGRSTTGSPTRSSSSSTRAVLSK